MGKVKDTIKLKKVIMIDPCEFVKVGNNYTKEIKVSGAGEPETFITVSVGSKEFKDVPKIFEG